MKKQLLYCGLILPFFAYAEAGTDIFSFQQFLFDFLSSLSYLFLVATVAFFIFGVVKFIKNADDSKERETGKSYIVWALIALVVLVSLWGFVTFLADTFGISTGGQLPYVHSTD